MFNSHQLPRIGEKKIFHELDVHHVEKVGIDVFGLRRPKLVSQPSACSNWREENFS